jgi:DNA-binding transcriptional ArsR family regulator
MEALTAVFRHSRAEATDRLVLLVLANSVNEESGTTYLSVGRISERARVSERTVQYALRRLEESGEITRAGKHPQFGTMVYRLNVSAEGVQDLRPLHPVGVQPVAPGGVQPVAPNPKEDPKASSSRSSKKKDARIMPLADEPHGFTEWLGHHLIECQLPPMRAETVARTKVAQAFRNLMEEGRTMHELKLASTAMSRDEWRMAAVQRRTPAVLLRPAAIDGWIAKGLELEAAPRSDLERVLAEGRPDPRIAMFLSNDEEDGTDG